jgi:hypothetical protein
MHNLIKSGAGLLLLLPWLVAAQGGLLLNNGIQVVCTGSIRLNIENGKWKNTAGTFVAGSSELKFTGNASAANSTIEGDPTTFFNLHLNKSQNNLRLETGTTTVTNQVIFTNRNIDLNGNQLALGANALLISEQENSRTYSAQPQSRTTHTNPLVNPVAANPGNLGMVITGASNFGTTTIDRRHQTRVLPSGNSIQKYWRTSALANPPGTNATLRFHYFDAELIGLNEADLTIWRSDNNGVTWTDVGFSNRNTTSNYVEQNGFSNINAWWTLGAPSPLNGGAEERTVAAHSPATWQVFPNPAVEQISVVVPEDLAGEVMLEWWTLDGKLAMSLLKHLETGVHTIPVELGDLPAGVYFLCLPGRNYPPLTLQKVNGR